MTYCVGWIDRNSAYLITDTLRTQRRPPSAERSVVNELHRQINATDFVEESLLKLVEIRSGIACAIAGDVSRAFDVVDYVAQNIDHFDSADELLASLNVNFLIGPERPVALLLAWSSAASPPVLAKWVSTDGSVERGDVLQMGSLNEELQALTRRTIARIAPEIGVDPAVMLAAILGCVQSYGLHEDLLAENVGGAICGLAVANGSTAWQPDTMTIVSGRETFFEGYIAAHFRDGVLMLNSSYQPDLKLLVNRDWRDRLAAALEWRQRWGRHLERYVPDLLGECQFWIFLSRVRRVVSLAVLRRSPRETEHPFRLQTNEDSFELVPSDEFSTALQRAAPAHCAEERFVDLRVVVSS